MAVRILLLIAFTGLFATAWNSDGRGGPTDELAASARQLPEHPAASDEVQPVVVSESGNIVRVSSEFDMSVVSLPESIGPGTYRVVDAHGRVGWITIAAEDQASAKPTTVEPLYATQSENERWYFIRVESAPVIAAPQGESSARR